MAYGDGDTPAVVEARRLGLPIADGIDLLVAQAELSFRIWTGRESPSGVMERAARKRSRGAT
jgi:shikimate 5-dehydrogenase